MNGPAATAEQRQAEYFLRLLAQICKRTNLRIDMYQRACARADSSDNTEHDWELRHLMRIEEQDRKIVNCMIDRLGRRLPLPAPDEDAPDFSAGAAAVG